MRGSAVAPIAAAAVALAVVIGWTAGTLAADGAGAGPLGPQGNAVVVELSCPGLAEANAAVVVTVSGETAEGTWLDEQLFLSASEPARETGVPAGTYAVTPNTLHVMLEDGTVMAAAGSEAVSFDAGFGGEASVTVEYLEARSESLDAESLERIAVESLGDGETARDALEAALEKGYADAQADG